MLDGRHPGWNLQNMARVLIVAYGNPLRSDDGVAWRAADLLAEKFSIPEVEMVRLLKVWMDQPRYHTTEDGRWDYRVTILFKNATVANEPFDEEALKKQVFPDQETYTREEQRRFEILDAHWDLPIRAVDLER